MRVLKRLSGNVSSLVHWVVRQLQIVRGKEETSVYTRFIALITLASLVMVVVFAAKLLYDYQRVYHLKIATGGKGGEYYAFGKNLEQVINENQWRIRVETRQTLGSCENMQLLDNREVGLAIVQQIVTNHNGSVRVESDYGKGTSFYVTLPIKD